MWGGEEAGSTAGRVQLSLRQASNVASNVLGHISFPTEWQPPQTLPPSFGCAFSVLGVLFGFGFSLSYKHKHKNRSILINFPVLTWLLVQGQQMWEGQRRGYYIKATILAGNANSLTELLRFPMLHLKT